MDLQIAWAPVTLSGQKPETGVKAWRVLIMRSSEIPLCIAYCFATAATHFSLDKKTVGEYSDVHIPHK